MIHILNGDSLIESFKQSNIKGEYIVWRECLFEGPVFNDKEEIDFTKIRAKYIRDTYGQDELIYMRDFNEVINKLQVINNQEEIVLWFDYDLFCQINLMYLLKVIAGNNSDRAIYLVLPKNYEDNRKFKGFGGLSGEQLEELFACKKSLCKEDLAAAEKFWKAYISSDTLEFEQLLNSTDNTFPFLKEALQAHLERFPSWQNGLNKIEQIIIDVVDKGINDKIAIMEKVWSEASVYGLGDLQILKYIEKLSNNNLLIDEEKIELTKLGKEVLKNMKNYIDFMKKDTWIGGVYLNNSSKMWLWDRDNCKLEGVEENKCQHK